MYLRGEREVQIKSRNDLLLIPSNTIWIWESPRCDINRQTRVTMVTVGRSLAHRYLATRATYIVIFIWIVQLRIGPLGLYALFWFHIDASTKKKRNEKKKKWNLQRAHVPFGAMKHDQVIQVILRCGHNNILLSTIKCFSIRRMVRALRSMGWI